MTLSQDSLFGGMPILPRDHLHPGKEGEQWLGVGGGSRARDQVPLGGRWRSHVPLGGRWGSHVQLGGRLGSHVPLGGRWGSHVPLGACQAGEEEQGEEPGELHPAVWGWAGSQPLYGEQGGSHKKC